MKIKEIMTPTPAYALVNTSLRDVARMMADYNCGCIPVIEFEENQTPIGVITDRDITIRTIPHGKDPLNMTVGEVMTDIVIKVTPEMSVEDCVATMERNQIRRVVVVDDDGYLQGMVAQADIARMASAFATAELVKDLSKQAAG